jgi:small-conductance mechanosensitive channel/CRP-like cAMP-binding protein
MDSSNWHEAWFIWGIILGFGFPLITILLEEVIQRLKRRKNPLVPTLQLVKNFVLPTFTFMVLVPNFFAVDRQGILSKILATLFWLSIVNVVLSAIQLSLFEGEEPGSWQSRFPKLLIQVCRLLSVLLTGALILSYLWGVDLTGFFWALGAVFLVIGLALKEPLGGILTGLMLVFERPFNVGDWLKVGEVEGRVVEMNWRTVHLLTANRKVMILPYQVFGQQVVCNHTAAGQVCSSSITLSFSYDNPPNLIKQVLRQTALSIQNVLELPPPTCTPLSYEGSTITYELEFYVKEFEQVKSIRGELMSRLWYAAHRNNLLLYHYNYECQVEPLSNRTENPKLKLGQMLSAIPAFIPIAKEQRQLEDLAKGTIIQHFGAGEQIIEQGERSHALYIVVTGSADMLVQDEEGELKVLTLSRSEIFGVESLFSRDPSSCSFIAAEDMEVIVIDEAAISTMARRQPNLSREMGKLIEVRKDAIALAKRRSRNEKRPQQKPQPELPDDLDYDVDISAVKLVKDANHNGKHPTKNAERNSKQIKQSE